MAVTIKKVQLYKDVWSMGKLQRKMDIIGMDVANVNIEVEVEGTEFPAEIEVTIKTREPGNKFSKRGTVKTPVSVKLKRAGSSVWYLKQIPLKEIATFWQAEMGILEVATVVRADGTSDGKFRGPLLNNGWSLRGIGKQPRSPGGDTGNDSVEQPDAKKLLFAGGVEVLEVEVVKQPGWKLKQTRDWAFVRSPADVMYYSGHGAIWNGQIVLHPDHEDWCTPEAILDKWKMKGNENCPADLDVLILNGCSLLNWEAKTAHNPMADYQKDVADARNIGLRWAELLCTKKGPLRVLLGNYDSAPLDSNPKDPNALTGDKIAENFAARMLKLGANWDQYAQAWLEVNKGTRAGAAMDQRGYWFTDKAGKIQGPIRLP